MRSIVTAVALGLAFVAGSARAESPYLAIIREAQRTQPMAPALLVYLGQLGFACLPPPTAYRSSEGSPGHWMWTAAEAERQLRESPQRDRLIVIRDGTPGFAELAAHCPPISR